MKIKSGNKRGRRIHDFQSRYGGPLPVISGFALWRKIRQMYDFIS